MKRLARNKSGKESYGPKWHSMESNCYEIENDDTFLLETTKNDRLSDASAPPAVTTETKDIVIVVDNEDQPQETSEGMKIKQNLSKSHESMYRATLEGDCVAAEMLLEENPNLAIDEITEKGDRSLHVAAALKHKKLVAKLVQRMSPSDLELLDGHGYTACCYAAISGVVDIADLMMRKNPTLATARDWETKTPLYKAALRGNAKMVSYFLKTAIVEDLPMEEWFQLLLVTIRREKYGVALEISRMNEQLSTMRNDEGTALHLLARQRFIKSSDMPWFPGLERPYIRSLAKKLLEDIQKLGKAGAVELMKNPPILHHAAEIGNVDLITMLTQTYPDLAWETDHCGYTIFHIAVIHRYENMFRLINEIGATKDLIALSEDENGNNILHLAAKLGPIDWRILPIPLFMMQWEMLWFRKVQETVQPICLEMKNKEGHTPRELFSKEHASLLDESRTWLRNTADSSMLISTLILSVLVASAFAVPGGYNQETGIPILYKASWFACFVAFDGLAMLFSVLSIAIFFVSLMLSSLNDDCYAECIPNIYALGLLVQGLSVVLGTSAFASAYILVYIETRPTLMKTGVAIIYVFLVCLMFLLLCFLLAAHPKRVIWQRTRHTLFNPL